MPRQPGVWRRKGKGGAWFSTIQGEQVWLAPPEATKRQAQDSLVRELAARQAGRPVRRAGLTAGEVVDLYLADRTIAFEHGELTRESLGGIGRFLNPFAERFGRVRVDDLRPPEVEAWVASQGLPGGGRTGTNYPVRKPWNQTTRARCTAMLRIAFRWAVKAGHLESSPLESMAGPVPLRREAVMSRAQVDLLLSAIPDDELRDVLNAMLLTGCRPIEVCTLTADNADPDNGVWKVRDKIRRKTGTEFRLVHLSSAAVELTRKMLAKHPSGFLFRNTKGNPWTRHAIGSRLQNYRGRLGIGKEGVAYSFRHLFATDALERGIPPATVAELLGHKSTAMVHRIYSHLSQRTDHLRAAAETVRPGPASASPGPAAPAPATGEGGAAGGSTGSVPPP